MKGVENWESIER